MIIACSGCAKENSSPAILLGDERFELPFQVSDLNRVGYSLVSEFDKVVVNGEDNSAVYANAEGQAVMVNLGTFVGECSLDESYVIDILSDVELAPSEMQVMGGVELGSTSEEVEAVYGKPRVEADNMKYYIIGDETKGTHVAVMNDEVIRIEALSVENVTFDN